MLAITAPTLIAAHDPPSVTFYNQALAVLGWGLLLALLGRATALGAPHQAARASTGRWALVGVLGIEAVAALWSGSVGALPGGLSLMGMGLSLAALLALQSGWHSGRSAVRDAVAEVFFGALTVTGALGLVLALIQVFLPGWADGLVVAAPTMVGRAVGNLRQPNHFSTLLVFACAGAGWLGARRRLPAGVAALLVALFIGAIVLTASRTGMVGMALLTVWGLADRRLPRLLRATLIAAPLVYGAWWGGMWLLSHADQSVAFAGEARLHDGSDISSSRFSIWANVLELIRQHPWTGVGYGEFNLAWTLTPFPHRPVAFFDHTHNLPLQWAVELGLPVAIVLLALTLWGFVSLVRPGSPTERATGESATVGAAAVIVAIAGLHSLLEYPLWYSYFLLPTAFAWGLGLAARERAPIADGAAPSSLTAKAARSASLRRAGGLTMAVLAIWCALDYQAAANIYAPRPWASPLAQRIAFGQKMPWWGYQADYAAVTVVDEDEASPPPHAFRRTLHNLLDARLMMAYARSLAEHGEVDKARFVVARLKEFHNASAKDFLAECDAPAEAQDPPPFQCAPPTRAYAWQELLPP